MYKSRRLTKTRDSQLFAIAGLVAGFSLITQLNLPEILRLDRLQHSLVSALLFLIIFSFINKQRWGFVYAIAGALSIGFLKEIFDHQAQNFDIFANFFGVFLGLIILIVYLGIIKQSVRHGIKRRY